MKLKMGFEYSDKTSYFSQNIFSKYSRKYLTCGD
eukprot:UN20995